MHSQIDAALGQRFFDLLGEHSLGADFGQSDVGNLVARGLDDFDLDFVSLLAQQRRDVVGLPECELRSARSYPELRHQRRILDFPPPTAASSSLTSALASRSPNSLRTRSMSVVASEDSRAALFSVVIGVCMILLTIPRVSASTASSCSGLKLPSRPRTRSISAWRTVSRCSCSETIVGTTSSVCSRAWNLSTSN